MLPGKDRNCYQVFDFAVLFVSHLSPKVDKKKPAVKRVFFVFQLKLSLDGIDDRV